VKVGDLVVRNNTSYSMGAPEVGEGIVLDSYENEDGVDYYEVQWLDAYEVRMWYDRLELKVVSESR